MVQANNQDRIVKEVLKLLPELANGLGRNMPEGARREGISVAQVKALVHLAEYGPLTMGELAEGLRVTMPSATGLVNPLVDMGYVVRERDREDRRVVQVRLADRARKLANQILVQRRAEVERALQRMDYEAQVHFLDGLTRLTAVYAAQRRRGWSLGAA